MALVPARPAGGGGGARLAAAVLFGTPIGATEALRDGDHRRRGRRRRARALRPGPGGGRRGRRAPSSPSGGSSCWRRCHGHLRGRAGRRTWRRATGRCGRWPPGRRNGAGTAADDVGAVREDLARARLALAEPRTTPTQLIAALPEPGQRSRAAARDRRGGARRRAGDPQRVHGRARRSGLRRAHRRPPPLPAAGGAGRAAAAVAFPGLVPTADQMAAERGRPQACKEGREIDQGIFAARGAALAAVRAALCSTPCCGRPRGRCGCCPDFSRTGAADLGSVRIERGRRRRPADDVPR